MRFKVLFALAAVACVPGAVQAQSSSLFGNRGVSAGSGTLANGVGGGNANSSQQQGVTGFLGTGAGSLNGFASGAQSQSAGGLAGTGAGTFVGNRNSAASAQGANGQAGRNGRTGANGGRSSLGGFNRNNSSGQRNRGNAANNSADTAELRPLQKIGFAFPKPDPQNFASSLGSQISGMSGSGILSGVSVVAGEAGAVTLKGEVSSDSDRRKAERLIRLEPGVRSVVNELTVKTP